MAAAALVPRHVSYAFSRLCRPLSTGDTGTARVHVERRSHVAVVTLSRPSKLNALDVATFREIRAAATSLRSDAAVRAVVIRGAGRAFSAGLDVKSLMRNPLGVKSVVDELLTENDDTGATLAQEVSYLWRLLPVPVVASIHGVCFGGGLQIALGADMRFASADARLSVMEGKWGLIPDMAGTLALRNLVRLDVAKDLTMTARVVGADEAQRVGLVTRVTEGNPFEDALAYAQELAGRSPDAVAAAKALLNSNFGRGSSDRAALRLEADLQRKLMGGWNQIAAALEGAGAPRALTPGFSPRSAEWDAAFEDLGLSEAGDVCDAPRPT